MKRWVKKHAGALLAAAVVLVILTVLVAVGRNREEKYASEDYTSYSAKDNGFKALYQSVRTAGERTGLFRAERFAKRARYLDGDAAVILPDAVDFAAAGGFEEEDMAAKAEGGATVLFLPADLATGKDTEETLSLTRDLLHVCFGDEINEGEPEVIRYEKTVFVSFPLGEGAVVFSVGEKGTENAGLREDNSYGADVLCFLCDLCGREGYELVLMDDYYGGIAESELWDGLGGWFILGTAELVLAALLWLYADSKRFGGPQKLPEAEERSETEGLEALAGLYRSTGAGSIGFCLHAEALLADLGRMYGLPDGSEPAEIAEELRAGILTRDREIVTLSNAYLKACREDISEKQAEKWIEMTDRIRAGLEKV